MPVFNCDKAVQLANQFGSLPESYVRWQYELGIVMRLAEDGPSHMRTYHPGGSPTSLTSAGYSMIDDDWRLDAAESGDFILVYHWTPHPRPLTIYPEVDEPSEPAYLDSTKTFEELCTKGMSRHAAYGNPKGHQTPKVDTNSSRTSVGESSRLQPRHRRLSMTSSRPLELEETQKDDEGQGSSRPALPSLPRQRRLSLTHDKPAGQISCRRDVESSVPLATGARGQQVPPPSPGIAVQSQKLVSRGRGPSHSSPQKHAPQPRSMPVEALPDEGRRRELPWPSTRPRTETTPPPRGRDDRSRSPILDGSTANNDRAHRSKSPRRRDEAQPEPDRRSCSPLRRRRRQRGNDHYSPPTERGGQRHRSRSPRLRSPIHGDGRSGQPAARPRAPLPAQRRPSPSATAAKSERP